MTEDSSLLCFVFFVRKFDMPRFSPFLNTTMKFCAKTIFNLLSFCQIWSPIWNIESLMFHNGRCHWDSSLLCFVFIVRKSVLHRLSPRIFSCACLQYSVIIFVRLEVQHFSFFLLQWCYPEQDINCHIDWWLLEVFWDWFCELAMVEVSSPCCWLLVKIFKDC